VRRPSLRCGICSQSYQHHFTSSPRMEQNMAIWQMSRDEIDPGFGDLGTERRIRGRFSRLGIGLLAYFADGGGGGGSGAVAPLAADPQIGQGCCGLATHTECAYTGSKSNFTCPSGSTKTYWICGSGSTAKGCGECAGGPSCFQSPWTCSIWWDLSP